MNKFLRISVWCVASLMVAAAMLCGPASAADPSVAARPEVEGDGAVLRLVSNPVGTQSWPVHAIQKFDLPKKYGIQLQVIPASGVTAAVTALRANGTDIALLQWPDLIRLRNAGVNVIGISPLFQLGGDYIIVPKDSPIKTLADFKGKKFGVTTRASVNWLLTQAAGRKLYNMDVDKDSVVREAAVSLLRGLMEQGELDGSHIFNNLAPEMVASGKFRVMAQMRTVAKDIGLPATPFLLWSVDTNYAKAHPKNVKAFNAMYRESVEILAKDDQLWAERGKELQMSTPAIEMLRDELREDLWTKFTPSTEADIQTVFKTFLEVSGPELTGFAEIPPGFITLEYQ